MRILFLHQNFPGQFLHLAPAMQARGHEVLALTDEGNQRPSPINTVRYRTPTTPKGGSPLAKTYGQMAERGAAVARAAVQLRDRMGFQPDLIVAHSGWGESLFLKEIWPDVRVLTYGEFLYNARGLDVGFDPEFQSKRSGVNVSITARAAHLTQAAVLADQILSPTEWQASTFPNSLRQKIQVIHDGIDTDKLRPDPTAQLELPEAGLTLRPGDEVLSFVSRRLEPYRGYHIFMRSLPDVLAARPDAQVVIIGEEGVGYGPRPSGDKSWKQTFLDEVSDRLDLTRVHFLGRVPYPRFLALMQVTRVHAYLTYPFVLSWSMLEAMSAGALVIGSETGPVTEVIEDGVNGRLVDFFDVPGWSAALTDALANPTANDGLRAAARETIVQRYDLKTRCLPALQRLLETGHDQD